MAIRNLRTLQRRKEKKRFRFLIVPPLITIALCLSVFFLAKQFLVVREIVFIGNHHLKNEELTAICRIKKNGELFGVSGRDIYLGLEQSPWVRDAVVRKELSGRVLVKVTEREPVALLNMNDKLFLIDNEGFVLEQMKEGTILLLPVIKGIDPVRDGETYTEAVRFVKVLHDKRVVSYQGDAEITGRRPEDITLKIDKMDIKVGMGDFEKKLARLAFVRDEIQKRNMNVEYIDLRFANKIIVKPVHEEAGEVGQKQGAGQ
ncbi:MAG: FtsQ-type POTRA domain-containing protein [Nitrospirae bacterium]|nr:FtsQ-type POTRA domain-containing protein [Nitrospirota bacterium]